MERKFLESFGLEKEAVDKILDENSRDIGKHKKSADELQTKLDTATEDFQTQLAAANEALTAANAEIESYKGMDIEGVKRSADEWKEKYSQLEAAREQEKKEQAEREAAQVYDNAVSEYFAEKKVRFSSPYAEKGFIEDFKAMGFKLNDGKLLGADDYINAQMEDNPTVFAPPEDAPYVKYAAGVQGKPQEQTKGDEFKFNFAPIRKVPTKE